MKRSIKALLRIILTALSRSIITTETVSTTGWSASTYYGTVTLPIPQKAGYTPLCIKRYGFNQAGIYAFNVSLTYDAVVLGICRRDGTTALSSVNPFAEVVYIRDILGGYRVTQSLQRLQAFPRLEVA